jgi:hypothetical protein
LSGSRLFLVGNCKRIAVSGGAGTLNPRGDGFETDFMAGALASVLVNPCPRPNSVANPTFRAFAGTGVVWVDGRRVANVPIGLGAGYMLPLPIARVEFWATPRAEYREAIAPLGDSSWDFAVSGGIDVGIGGRAGLRAALDCCERGIGGGYGVSLWF